LILWDAGKCDSGKCDPGKCDPGKCDPGKCDPGKCRKKSFENFALKIKVSVRANVAKMNSVRY
jgi:hypothetical protein